MPSLHACGIAKVTIQTDGLQEPSKNAVSEENSLEPQEFWGFLFAEIKIFQNST